MDPTLLGHLQTILEVENNAGFKIQPHDPGRFAQLSDQSHIILVGDASSNKTDLGFKPNFCCPFITDAINYCGFMASVFDIQKFTIFVLEGLYINACIGVPSVDLPTNFTVELIGINDVRILGLSTPFMYVPSGNWTITNIRIFQLEATIERHFVVFVDTEGDATFENVLISAP